MDPDGERGALGVPVFMPTQMFRSVASITPEYLKEHGIRALILDVDNTLTGHGSQELPEHVEKFRAWAEEFDVGCSCGSDFHDRTADRFQQYSGSYYLSLRERWERL